MGEEEGALEAHHGTQPLIRPGLARWDFIRVRELGIALMIFVLCAQNPFGS